MAGTGRKPRSNRGKLMSTDEIRSLFETNSSDESSDRSTNEEDPNYYPRVDACEDSDSGDSSKGRNYVQEYRLINQPRSESINEQTLRKETKNNPSVNQLNNNKGVNQGVTKNNYNPGVNQQTYKQLQTKTKDAIVQDTNETQFEGLSSDVRPTARTQKRTGKVLTRKRRREPSTWKLNVRKTLRQSGKEYIDSRGKVQPARQITSKKDCSKCKFKCSLNFSEGDRETIFNEFWTLTDNEKLNFYGQTIFQKTQRPKSDKSRRTNSISYHLANSGINTRVCKSFYLTTLNISQKRVLTYHNSKNETTGTPRPLQWGKDANNIVSEDVKNSIREHISSIPRMESHYCRSSTNKEYLANGLSVAILNDKYTQRCKDLRIVPAKLLDRCDTCESMKMNDNPTEQEKITHSIHTTGKVSTKAERDNDRNDTGSFIICFDLQNTFALPTADDSNIFYRRKLNVYHMTAHCSADKRGYGALWHEGQSGRSGNDIASSVVQILEAVYENNSSDPRIQNIILWSDSCVPQNKNRIMSTAIKLFLKNHPDIQTIIHKYSTPGHSSIQEVDNLHSQIERVCRNSEIYSPVGLLRLLKRGNREKPLKIIQMKSDYFKDYRQIANTGKFENIPYTQVKCLLYEQHEPKILKYKKTFEDEWLSEMIFERQWSRSGFTTIYLGEPKAAKAKTLPQAKIQDIKAMLKFMPPSDRAYMSLGC